MIFSYIQDISEEALKSCVKEKLDPILQDSAQIFVDFIFETLNTKVSIFYFFKRNVRKKTDKRALIIMLSYRFFLTK